LPLRNLKANSLNLYNLIICRLDGEGLLEPSYRRMMLSFARKGIGGFIVFKVERDTLRGFLKEIEPEGNFFIASDIERGVGQQISNYTEMPCQMAQASASVGDIKSLKRLISAIALEAIDAGINMPLIPVLDINSNPKNPIISTRAFSDDPRLVTRFGLEYIKILKGYGLISCPKHFPGHGDTEIDSHISLPKIYKTEKELMKKDILPFKMAIKEGARAVMAGHLLLPFIDDMPASLSKKILNRILRKKLGFKGLILTDALNMDALLGFKNPSATALSAGVDIILHPRYVERTIKEISSALDSGIIKEKSLEHSIRKISYIKRGLSLKRKGFKIDSHRALSEDITQRSITLIKSKTGILPIKRAKVVFLGDEALYKKSPLYEIKSHKSEHTIFAIFKEVRAWSGGSMLSPNEVERIKRLIKRQRHSIVISFGSPYILSEFPEADVLISAYEPSKNAQRAVIKCLMGDAPFQGVLPVKISDGTFSS